MNEALSIRLFFFITHSLHLDHCQVHDHGRGGNSVSLLYGCTIIYLFWGKQSYWNWNKHTIHTQKNLVYRNSVVLRKQKKKIKQCKLNASQESCLNEAPPTEKRNVLWLVSWTNDRTAMRLNGEKTRHLLFSEFPPEKETLVIAHGNKNKAKHNITQKNII